MAHSGFIFPAIRLTGDNDLFGNEIGNLCRAVVEVAQNLGGVLAYPWGMGSVLSSWGSRRFLWLS